ncbi:hypothetical protein Z517_09422 [Fonsecaea pedrosoi CBS 271.37]|uniref:Unplaced genomic scaffold supercont1.6, whole genome shotgun sequence n=1 Tax=Fonsecaea pedrosoi CBS 271.37 TaxID=1442368 RepID=A0A0D2G8I4_9EURO|nr:uncharacterized protein Z517_09422 [Fonsecaea pedrosoi CBS 271.37]KIW76978.1 hypothetical protein Z517_09422 [Fonsecaea pedrosoi CBS 271.37]
MPLTRRPNPASAQNNRRQSTTGPRPKTPIVKSLRRASTRRSARLQHAQPSPPPAPAPPPARNKRKRLNEDSEAQAETDASKRVCPSKQPQEPLRPEHRRIKENLQRDLDAKPNGSAGVHPCKQPREPQPDPKPPEDNVKTDLEAEELPPSKDQLSEKNLRLLRLLNGEEMDSAGNNAPSLRRTPSRRSIVPSEAVTETTRRTSHTATVYRRNNLVDAEIRIHVEPPDHIQAAIDRIIKAAVPSKRRSELRVIAQELRDVLFAYVQTDAGEQNFIQPLDHAIAALRLRNLGVNAKDEWRVDLKPVVRKQRDFGLIPSGQQLEVDDVSAALEERQQHTSANDSQSSSTTPSLSPPRSSVKTPRPDISLGIRITALISSLSAENLTEKQARYFLEWLQKKTVQREPNGPLESLLNPVPGLRASILAFPFFVVEGKAYSTGQQIYEAENQASVSAACGLKIQLDLDSLVNYVATKFDVLPTTSNTDPPLFFSICTEGPIHQLWAHWTVVEDGDRTFGSKLLDSWNALLLGQGHGLMLALNNIGAWGVGSFMESVVERLRFVVETGKVSDGFHL